MSYRLRDEEAANSPPLPAQNTPYHDDSDEDNTILSVDNQLPGSSGQSSEFGGLRIGGPAPNSWRMRIQEKIPPPVKKGWEATVNWVKGPNPPRIYTITPFFPKVQQAPLRLLDRYAPKRIHRFWLLILVYACWLLSFSLVLRASSVAESIPGHGSPIRLSCSSRYWEDGNGCGINGDQCRPFANATLAFRCPADCHKTLELTPHAIGDQELVYKPLVVGGPTGQQTGFEGEIQDNAVYRGDSFICASAIHSGFIKKSEGGCGVLTLTGEQTSFTASSHSGIDSFGFDSYFPHSFGFLSGTRAQCKDLRWPALAISAFFTALLSVFTTSPSVFFWSMFTALFFHVALASDPPSETSYWGLLSIAFARFLPACFCAWVTYRYTVKRSLANLTAQIEKTILWLGAAWVGSLNNYTFDRIPIQRLTPHDIKAQPGAIPALIIVVLTIFVIALGQAWAFRVEGRMPRYLVIYGIFVVTLLIMLALPGLNLRIHHYILGLLLLPGTSFQNRPSLVYQGLLLGLFINGVARWGFASILETPSSLLEGFQTNSLLPAVSVLAIGARNITFNFGPLPIYDPKIKVTYDGISVLVNDVERFHGYGDDRSYWDTSSGNNFTWTWTRHSADGGFSVVDSDVNATAHQPPEYFRFGYLSGNQAADFTKAGRWNSDGKWVDMQPGPSLTATGDGSDNGNDSGSDHD